MIDTMFRRHYVATATAAVFRRYGLPGDLEPIARRPLPAPAFGLQLARIGISLKIVADIRDIVPLCREDRDRVFGLIDAAAEEAGR
jgi:hypothetical protein